MPHYERGGFGIWKVRKVHETPADFWNALQCIQPPEEDRRISLSALHEYKGEDDWSIRSVSWNSGRYNLWKPWDFSESAALQRNSDHIGSQPSVRRPDTEQIGHLCIQADCRGRMPDEYLRYRQHYCRRRNNVFIRGGKSASRKWGKGNVTKLGSGKRNEKNGAGFAHTISNGNRKMQEYGQ